MFVKHKPHFLLIASLLLLASAPMCVLGQNTISTTTGPGAKADKKGEHASGMVTAVDPTTNTITIFNKKTNTTVVATLTAKTKFTKSSPIAFSALAIGDNILATSRDYTAGATTITANRITVESPLGTGKKHESKHGVEGTIITLTPLAISTEDGTSVAVTTDSATKYVKTAAATINDVKVGQHVEAKGKMAGSSLTAKEITIEPAHGKKS